MANQLKRDIHELGRNKQNFITHNIRPQDSPTTTMLITESQSTPPVATDQYHHTETIWRIILDIISLIICKINIFF